MSLKMSTERLAMVPNTKNRILQALKPIIRNRVIQAITDMANHGSSLNEAARNWCVSPYTLRKYFGEELGVRPCDLADLPSGGWFD